MSSDRYPEIIAMLIAAENDVPGELKLCEIAATLTGLDGAGIGLRVEDGQFTILCTSNSVVQQLMEIELTISEGPCTDVCHRDRAVSEGYFDSLAVAHWPIFVPLAKTTGARAAHGFPIDIGAIRIGALVLYSFSAGALSPDQTCDGQLLASVIARAVLAIQAGAPPGALASELLRTSTFDPAIQQAAGMVSVQGNMSIGDALVTLRAHGFATGLSPSVLAAQIVAREIRFDAVLGYWDDIPPAEIDNFP